MGFKKLTQSITSLSTVYIFYKLSLSVTEFWTLAKIANLT